MKKETPIEIEPAGWGMPRHGGIYIHWFPARWRGFAIKSICGTVPRYIGETSEDSKFWRGHCGKCERCEASLPAWREKQASPERLVAEFPVGLPARIDERWLWHLEHSPDPRKAIVAEFKTQGLTPRLRAAVEFRSMAGCKIPVIEMPGLTRIRLKRVSDQPTDLGAKEEVQ